MEKTSQLPSSMTLPLSKQCIEQFLEINSNQGSCTQWIVAYGQALLHINSLKAHLGERRLTVQLVSMFSSVSTVSLCYPMVFVDI